MADLETLQDHEPVGIPVLDLTRMRVLCPLGRGARGAVFRVRVPGSDDDVALKVVPKSSLKTKNGDREFGRVGFEREVLRCLRHPLLPRLRGVLETEHVIGYAIDYCPGRDLNWVRQNQSEKTFADGIIRFYGAELVLALEHLHNQGIVYRDLKPDNILIQESGHLMLVDFDLSTKLAPRTPMTRFNPPDPDLSLNSDPPKRKAHCISCLNPGFSMEDSESESDSVGLGLSEWESSEKTNSFVGTEEYVAPEIIAGDGHDYGVDWWCLGVVMYEMLYGTTPFRGSNRKETFYRILSKKPDLAGETTPLRGLIERLLEKDPAKRIQLEEIKGHDFFKGVDWEMIWRIQRPPFIPLQTDVDEDLEGIKEEIDVESIVREIFCGKKQGRNNGNSENEGILENNPENKKVWVEGLDQPHESENFSVF